jgi:hypothetical protein
MSDSNLTHLILSSLHTRQEGHFMRIGVNLGPTGDWSAMLAAAKIADASGFDALGFLDHYHAEKPEWPYICGWATYGALAMASPKSWPNGSNWASHAPSSPSGILLISSPT